MYKALNKVSSYKEIVGVSLYLLDNLSFSRGPPSGPANSSRSEALSQSYTS